VELPREACLRFKYSATPEIQGEISRVAVTAPLARYAKHNGNFVLVVSGSLEAQRTKKFIEILYDLLIKAIELRSFALLKFGVRSEGLK
jgi:hypothetical protein